MSEEAPETPPQEPEAIPGIKVGGTLFATLAIFGGSALIVLVLFHLWIRGRQGYRHAQIPEAVSGRTIAEVEQLPFSVADHEKKARAQALSRLTSYGWVDKQKGLAHEPIDVAIDSLLRDGGAR